MTNNATGERKKQSRLINQQQTMNNRLFTTVNNNTRSAFKMPAGISRMAVRGFFASNCLSRYRLKAMAALRAKTMHKITSNNNTPTPPQNPSTFQAEEINAPSPWLSVIAL